MQITDCEGPTRNNFWDPHVSKDSLDMNLERQLQRGSETQTVGRNLLGDGPSFESAVAIEAALT